MQIKAFVVMNNYNNDTSWIKEYTNDYIIYNKGEPINDTKAIQVPNVGYNIFDYLSYVIDNYDDLPQSVMFIKSNIFPRHMTKEEFDEVCERTEFTPLLSKTHKTDGKINFYKDGLYWEVNNYWYANHFGIKSIQEFDELATMLGATGKAYLGFSPGACMIVPKKNILKYPVDFYKKIKDAVSYTQLPGEAHLVERCLCNIWSSDIITT